MKHTKCYIKEYPRPQLVRPDWVNLNGEWSFGFEDIDAKEALQGELPLVIRVPFTYETKLSGIHRSEQHNIVWYAKKIKGKIGKRSILHFEGADYDTEVYIDGQYVGCHRGAYTRFSIDVTDYLTENESLLVVKCSDESHPIQVLGKQRWKKENFGCWYVQTTGLYKSVWMEYVENTYLTSIKITPELKDYSVQFNFSVNAPDEDVEVRFAISFDGELIQTASLCANEKENSLTVQLTSNKLQHQVAVWSPYFPNLYDVEIFVYKNGVLTDKVGSYFGLRDYRAKEGKILLNEAPFYAKLLLDQGYWADSSLTPPNEEALMKDIELSKQMGFNGVRKHQKTEDERFFYYADIMGFTVWCEMPSNHWFADVATKEITREWLDIVTQYYNHPSLVTWVVFNESWGIRNIYRSQVQSNLATGLYYLTKSIDTMRPVISNDGWVHAKSDILTLHHYEQDADRLLSYYESLEKQVKGSKQNPQLLPYAEGYSYEGQPIVFSEFGGAAYISDCEEKGNWGYGSSVKNDAEFLARYGSLIEAIQKMDINGYCYTQLSDVEQEVNGLLDVHHQPKIPVEEIRKRNG